MTHTTRMNTPKPQSLRVLSSVAVGALLWCCAGSQAEDSAMAAAEPNVVAQAQAEATPPEHTAEHAAEHAADHTAHRAEAPIQALWTHSENVDETTSPLTVELSIDRVPAWAAPIQITTTLPDGVTLVDGPETLEIAPDVTNAVLSWTLAFESLPNADFVVQVDARGEGFGFHAEPRIRFGRPEPAVMDLQRVDDEVEYNGLPLGRPIDMNP